MIGHSKAARGFIFLALILKLAAGKTTTPADGFNCCIRSIASARINKKI